MIGPQMLERCVLHKDPSLTFFRVTHFPSFSTCLPLPFLFVLTQLQPHLKTKLQILSCVLPRKMSQENCPLLKLQVFPSLSLPTFPIMNSFHASNSSISRRPPMSSHRELTLCPVHVAACQQHAGTGGPFTSSSMFSLVK